MLAVALACLAVTGFTTMCAFAALRWQHRAHDRERQAWTAERGLILDRLSHLAGRTWTPPPARVPERREPVNAEQAADELLASGW